MLFAKASSVGSRHQSVGCGFIAGKRITSLMLFLSASSMTSATPKRPKISDVGDWGPLTYAANQSAKPIRMN
jgi:hypothetical protein